MLNKVTKFAIVCLMLTLFVVGSEVTAGALVLDGFESYNVGTIHDQGMTWEVVSCDGEVVSGVSHAGEKSLRVDFRSNLNTQSVTWWDDHGVHSGQLELSWWINPTESGGNRNLWGVEIYGWGGSQVASICNWQAGSATTIDVLNGDNTWQEVLALVPTEQWTQITLGLDLDSQSDRYRVKSGSGSWSDWYSLGSQETALRKVSFRTYTSAFSDYDSHTYYVDDLTLVPEPATLGLLALGGLAMLRRRRTA